MAGQNQQAEEAVDALRRAVQNGGTFETLLWDALLFYQNVSFYTSGRGSRPGLPFTYTVKIGRNGEYVKELLISRKENSKTITGSTINRALETALAVQEAEGYVKGPKRLGTFGASYLYSIFLEFGLITRFPLESAASQRRGPLSGGGII